MKKNEDRRFVKMNLENFYKTLKLLEKFSNTPLATISKIHNYNVAQWQLINNTKMFQIEEDVKQALLLTNNKIEYKPLPFPRIFLECCIKIKNIEIYGIQIYDNEQIRREAIKNNELDCIIPENSKFRNDYIISCFSVDNKKNTITRFMRYIQHDDVFNKSNKDLDYNYSIKCGFNEKDFDKVRIFIMNFLDFLNNPEVETIRIDRTEEQNIKRIRKGKLPIPPQIFIKIDGKLRKYLDELNSGKHFNYSHKFWVRGHFRTLKNEGRYKDRVGTKMWILPYIKGKGILIDKHYNLDKSKLEVKPNSSHD